MNNTTMEKKDCEMRSRSYSSWKCNENIIHAYKQDIHSCIYKQLSIFIRKKRT